ncbi:unnamed protein product [Toxocara canis]|uniref:Catalase n=1 Tax=Toxocara canis TaxID=6265 RepID=A0A183VFB8_TOXCA|nr:unnamed protein product [Toxocara canis]
MERNQNMFSANNEALNSDDRQRYQAAIHYNLTQYSVPQIFGANPARDQYSASVFMSHETRQSLQQSYPDENKENEPTWRT